ncbi:MAG TPA: HYR domain-containing protein [Candidatus Binatia bacterium]|nr:HYR domain-containing protein [Candidatus Binatia bacterium]
MRISTVPWRLIPVKVSEKHDTAALRPPAYRQGLLICGLVLWANTAVFAGASGRLDQGANGPTAAPTSPINWLNGNLTTNNCHYVEGQSVPCRLVLTGLTGGPHVGVIEWDIVNSGKDAFDYITHYNRIAQLVDPLSGLTDSFTAPSTVPIPVPIPTLTVNGLPQPQTSFGALSAGENLMTIYNGTITALTYITNGQGNLGDLGATQSPVDLQIEFDTTNSTVVLAWGGHLAARLYWGAGHSAGGAPGAPYHMRFTALDGAATSQDLSVDGPAVCVPPTNSLAGPNAVCGGTTNTYSDTSDGAAFVWSLVGNGTLLAPATNSTVTVLAGAAGSYTLTVTATASGLAGACASTASQTVTVNPLPACAISGPSPVCPLSLSNVYSGPAGMASYAWAISGYGSLVGPTNTPTVSVTAAGLCGQNFTLALQLTDTNGCASACSLDVPVNNGSTPPTFVMFPADAVVECPNSTLPTATGQPTATDTCSTASIAFADTTTSGLCSNQVVRTITRAWTATDACGNSVTQSQVITVKDTTPPTFVMFPADAVVECPNSTLPTATGQPTATDTCSTASITFADTTTSGLCSNQMVRTITRAWTATDACGNSVTQSQVITVKDTTPPTFVTFPADAVVECPNSTLPTATGQPTATDTCSTASITFADTTTSGLCSNQVVRTITRAWTATDACGNSVTQSQVITVKDTTAPQIICQTNIIAAEAPRDSGGAAVSFPPALASDTCDPNPLVFSFPAAGSVFPNGSNTVTCVAMDACGNTNSCTFDVRVIPYRLFVTNTLDSGPGSLRQALLDANDSPDQNLVLFKLPGAGPFTIQPLTPLPEITSPIIIDGWSQSGSNMPPTVALDGGGASNTIDGLVLVCSSNTVRGLVFSRFGTAIRLLSNGYNIIQGNFIGVDFTGTNQAANTGDGLYVSSPGNFIGGTTPGVANVLGGNAGNGIQIATSAAISNSVQGNFIGIAADGLTPVGNGLSGVLFSDQASRNSIGGTAVGEGNFIAFNGHNGITLSATAGQRNALLGNRIFSDGALGIDLGDDGVTLNGTGNTNGPNQAQSFPVLTDAQAIAGTTTIYGGATGPPNVPGRIEFFLNDAPNPSGYGEGKLFIGAIFVSFDANGAASFAAPFPLDAAYTQFITATATDSRGNTSEFSRAVQVRTPPVLQAQPVSTNAPVGGAAAFCATAVGTPPIQYQWRLNGINIPGATNQCYFISAADVTNGGSYSVVVGNVLGALATETASLTLPITNIQGADFFSNRVSLFGVSGQVAGQNRGATAEPGEPLHAGKPGGKSVWYTWMPQDTGVSTIGTIGSTFDTLLAVYTGSIVSNLTSRASDVVSGGHYTSRARFNAINGAPYQIAIDGFGGDSGDYVFSWSEVDTPHLLPVFRVPPTNETVTLGSTATFTTVAVRVCGDGHENCPNPSHYPPEDVLPGLGFQWFFYGSPIPGATSTSLTLSNVQPSQVGNYTVQVSTRWQTNESEIAFLQINETGGTAQHVQAADQFLDAVDGNPLLIGAIATGGGQSNGPLAGTVVSGYTGTQIFNTGGSGTSPNEVICGVIGGASEWIAFVPLSSGNLLLTTDGSLFPTVMAVFVRSATNPAVLVQVGCAKTNGVNGLGSELTFPVAAGQTNYIDVDGINGVTGVLQLNYSLVTLASLTFVGLTPQGAPHVQLSGRAGLHFTIQASTNLANWVPLVTTNSTTGTFDYIDTAAPLPSRRYYRALLLP